jgi:hypothetical protein
VAETLTLGQGDAKLRVARPGKELEFGPVVKENFLHPFQPHAGAFAHAFGGAKRIENPGLNLLGNTGATAAEGLLSSWASPAGSFPNAISFSFCCGKEVKSRTRLVMKWTRASVKA